MIKIETIKDKFRSEIIAYMDKVPEGGEPQINTIHAVLFDRGLCGYPGSKNDRGSTLRKVIDDFDTEGTEYKKINCKFGNKIGVALKKVA